MEVLHQIKSLPPVKLTNCDKAEIRAYFNNTWDLYELLFSSIESDDSLYLNPDPRRHPLIFYLGHTAVFYINKFYAVGIIDHTINPHFENILAVGVDPATARDLETRDLWPGTDEVRAYRNQARELILKVIDEADFPEKVTWDHPLWTLFMGLEHDRIHFETSSVLIRQYPVSHLRRPAPWQYAPAPDSAPANSLVELSGGSVTLGRPDSADLYGWDNEYGLQEFVVDPFSVSRNMISNAEFLEFVRQGGYSNLDLWSEEGLEWKEKYKVCHPRFWIAEGDGFRYRAMFDEMDLPLSWPAEVTCHEAQAYCAWKGDGWRLMWEREWKYLSNQAPEMDQDVVFDQKYNLNLKYCSPTPVGMMSEGQTTSGVNDIHGNVWDWLGDDFYQLPGYKTHHCYLDFSAPYFDADHGMLAGGSWASSGTSASKYYRLWFRRGFFQHAGFRLAKSV
jgi:5-histidylcysteine sulfoxide synthase